MEFVNISFKFEIIIMIGYMTLGAGYLGYRREFFGGWVLGVA